MELITSVLLNELVWAVCSVATLGPMCTAHFSTKAQEAHRLKMQLG